MREYELTVLYDLSVAEAGGADAAPTALTALVEARGGKVLKVDHWGRRRMAYPIGKNLDADYVVMRAEVEPSGVSDLEGVLRITESIYRHIVVRADEIPIPPPPREPRMPRPMDGEPPADVAATPPVATEEAALATDGTAEAEAPAEAEASAAVEAVAAVEAPAEVEAQPAEDAPAEVEPVAEAEPEAIVAEAEAVVAEPVAAATEVAEAAEAAPAEEAPKPAPRVRKPRATKAAKAAEEPGDASADDAPTDA